MNNELKLPLKVHAQLGVKKFCEKTGDPLAPVNYYWVRDAKDDAFTLFIGDERMGGTAARVAKCLNMHDQLVATVQRLKDLACQCDVDRCCETCNVANDALIKAGVMP